MFKIKGKPAISAVRLAGSWVIQLPYGAAVRSATEEESAVIDAAWNGDTDGGGNDWAQLCDDAEMLTL